MVGGGSGLYELLQAGVPKHRDRRLEGDPLHGRYSPPHAVRGPLKHSKYWLSSNHKGYLTVYRLSRKQRPPYKQRGACRLFLKSWLLLSTKDV